MSNKWTRFSEDVSFKGITDTNKEILLYIASKHNSNGVILTYKEIGSAVGVTKHTARRNIRKMESLGLIKTKNQFPSVGYRDTLPLKFFINLCWRNYE